MVIIPYIVLAAVAALFFAVSYFIICGFPMKRRKAEEMENGEEEKKGLPDLEKEKKPPVHKAVPVDDATRIIPVKPKRPAPVRFDEEEEDYLDSLSDENVDDESDSEEENEACGEEEDEEQE